MRRRPLPQALGVAACVLCCAWVPAQDKAAIQTAGVRAYEALCTAFKSDYDEYVAASRALIESEDYKKALAKRDTAAINKLRSQLQMPQKEWAPKFLETAKQYDGDDQARFLVWVTTNTSGKVAEQALDTLVAEHMDSELLLDMIKKYGVPRGAGGTGRTNEVYAKIIAQSPHVLVQCEAMYQRAQAVQRNRNATAADKSAAAADLAKVRELAPEGSMIALRVAAPEFDRQRLQVGMSVPDIAGEDLDGVKFKLSDYRGKVVVLDFWGDW